MTHWRDPVQYTSWSWRDWSAGFAAVVFVGALGFVAFLVLGHQPIWRP